MDQICLFLKLYDIVGRKGKERKATTRGDKKKVSYTCVLLFFWVCMWRHCSERALAIQRHKKCVASLR